MGSGEIISQYLRINNSLPICITKCTVIHLPGSSGNHSTRTWYAKTYLKRRGIVQVVFYNNKLPWFVSELPEKKFYIQSFAREIKLTPPSRPLRRFCKRPFVKLQTKVFHFKTFKWFIHKPRLLILAIILRVSDFIQLILEQKICKCVGERNIKNKDSY